MPTNVKGGIWEFLNIHSLEKIGKNEGGTLWRHLKNLRKKVSLSRKQLLEAFEKIYIFLKSIRLKSHSAEKPKGGTLWSHLLYFWKHKNIMV